MGRPSKPVANCEKHLTKAEIEQRTRFENSLLSGRKIRERERVKLDPVAHCEFRRVIGLLRAIGKDDALYSEQINRYAELFSECEFYKDELSVLRGMLSSLRSVTDEVGGYIRQSTSGDADALKGLCEALDGLLSEHGKLMKQLSDIEIRVKQKREAMTVIERENCMTVAAALRTIPKEADKGENDELLEILKS